MCATSLHTSAAFITAAFILQSVTYVASLTCYQCTIRLPPTNNGTSRLCSHFDYSSKFAVDCPHSTFCMKKTFRLPLQNNKSVEISLRDCAPQKYIYQSYKNGKWNLKEDVKEDVYQPGCQMTDNSAGFKTNSEQYCYCDSHLCNSSQSTKDSSAHTDIMTVIFVFNAMKYIRSVR